MFRRLQRFDLLVAAGCLVLLGYFAWHASKGPRGFSYLASLEARADTLAGELATEETARGRLEAKVELMRPERVDPDMLEELARTQLELSRRNELVVRFQN